MESNEMQELQEHAEHAEHDRMLRPVALTMTFLAVLVAVTTVLGHRTHTEVVLDQDKATDKWGEYQAQKTRSYNTTLSIDLIQKVLTITDKEAAKKLVEGYREHQEKWAEETKDDMAEAKALEAEVEKAETKANRFDFGEALLEIGLVITSITLLTHKRIYWFIGLGFSVIGIVTATLGVLLK